MRSTTSVAKGNERSPYDYDIIKIIPFVDPSEINRMKEELSKIVPYRIRDYKISSCDHVIILYKNEDDKKSLLRRETNRDA